MCRQLSVLGTRTGKMILNLSITCSSSAHLPRDFSIHVPILRMNEQTPLYPRPALLTSLLQLWLLPQLSWKGGVIPEPVCKEGSDRDERKKVVSETVY